jgi:hypothetical protein
MQRPTVFPQRCPVNLRDFRQPGVHGGEAGELREIKPVCFYGVLTKISFELAVARKASTLLCAISIGALFAASGNVGKPDVTNYPTHR